jgi:hypothetical protein
LQRSFRNHIFLHSQVMFRAASVVIRLALQISFATLEVSLLPRTGPADDITALAARVKSTASCGLSK